METIYKTKMYKKTIGKVLILIVLIQCLSMYFFSQNRYFNFDEFRIVYESSFLLKGKGLYKEEIGAHFPLANLILASILKIYGFKANFLLLARLLIIFIIFLCTYMIYNITAELRNREAGLMAVMLTMSSLVFLNKGIEIRWDAFSMTFNTIGIFWSILFLKRGMRYPYLYLSMLFFGLAIASTQKAVMWSFCVLIYIGYFVLKNTDLKDAGKEVFKCLVILISPLVLSFLIVIGYGSDTVVSVLGETVIKLTWYLSPESLEKSVYPFPYPKSQIYMKLLYENGLLYTLFLLALAFYLFRKADNRRIKLICLWSLGGCLFYLYTKRPFYQSFLPTVPSIAIIVAIFLEDFRRSFCAEPSKRVIALTLFLVGGLIVWPSHLFANKLISSYRSQAQNKQMENALFCEQFLSSHDEVLCFTKQQLFFDPVFRFYPKAEEMCKYNKITEIKRECFINRMIDSQCWVVINDHRTRLLDMEIRKIISYNFRPVGRGDILVPGFIIPPNAIVSKEVWKKGIYSLSSQLFIDGFSAGKGLVNLGQRIHRFRNQDSKPVLLLYRFE